MTPRSPAVLQCLTCVSDIAPIKSTYLIHKANFVACHNPAYVRKYNMVQELVDGGTFLLNCPWDMEGLEKHLPGQVKKFIADHNINFYTIDGVKIGIETGMGPTRINTILQSAFFELTEIIPAEKANELMKAAAKATYGRKGEDVVMKNWAAIDAGAKGRCTRFRFRKAGRTARTKVLTWFTLQREERTLLTS